MCKFVTSGQRFSAGLLVASARGEGHCAQALAAAAFVLDHIGKVQGHDGLARRPGRVQSMLQGRLGRDKQENKKTGNRLSGLVGQSEGHRQTRQLHISEKQVI